MQFTANDIITFAAAIGGTATITKLWAGRNAKVIDLRLKAIEEKLEKTGATAGSAKEDSGKNSLLIATLTQQLSQQRQEMEEATKVMNSILTSLAKLEEKLQSVSNQVVDEVSGLRSLQKELREIFCPTNLVAFRLPDRRKSPKK